MSMVVAESLSLMLMSPPAVVSALMSMVRRGVVFVNLNVAASGSQRAHVDGGRGVVSVDVDVAADGPE